MRNYRRLFDEETEPVPVDEDYPQDLDNLAMIMSSTLSGFPDDVGSNDAVPDQRRNAKALIGMWQTRDAVSIPAGYTYFGQLMIHDISHLEHSDRHIIQNLPWEQKLSNDYWNTVGNLSEPDFNLEGVYGKDPSINSALVDQNEDLPFLKVGWTQPTARGQHTDARSLPCDLPRKANSVEPDIPDKRNDENLLIAQTLLAFIKFHNALVLELSKKREYLDADGKFDKVAIFEKARKLNIRYYQTIILHDFLPRIIDQRTYRKLETTFENDPLTLRDPADRFIPLEFSIGAFRFGHSMIREQYEYNVLHESVPTNELQTKRPASLHDLQLFTGVGLMGQNKYVLRLQSNWIIDWNRFYELDAEKPNFAERINTVLPDALLKLRPLLKKYTNGRASCLAALDLFRSQQSSILSGQQIAERRDLVPLKPYWIRLIIRIKRLARHDVTDETRKEIKRELVKRFESNTPLWFYVLAEAERQRNGKLGQVGGHIVAETIYRLIYDSGESILREPEWNGDDFWFQDDKFDMPTMLRRIQQVRYDQSVKPYPPCDEFDELNPLGSSSIIEEAGLTTIK